MAGNTTKKLTLVIAGEDQASKVVEGVGKSVGGLQGQLGGLGTTLGGVLSLGAITAFGSASVDAFAKAAGEVAKIKRLTGESAESASLLAFAAQQSGVDAGKASQAWTILAKNIDNGKVAAQGIATADASGDLLPFEQILANIADKYNSLGTNIERTALAQKLFGKGGAEIGKILSKGGEGIEDLRSEMQELGLEFDQEGLDKLKRYMEVQRDFAATVTGTKVAVGERLLPVLSTLGEWFTSAPQPVKAVTLAVGGLTAGVAALSLGVGILKPGLTALSAAKARLTGTTAAATAVTAGLATAEAAAAAAAEAEAAASAHLQAVLGSQVATEAEVTAALAAKTTATAAAAAANEGLAASQAAAAASSTGMLAPLAAVAAALGVAYGLAKAYGEVSDSKVGDFGAVDTSNALKATNEQLAILAGQIDGVGQSQAQFEQIGNQDIKILYAMRDAAKANGDSHESLDNAIREVEGNTARAAARTDEYGGSTDDTTTAVQRQTSSVKELNDALEANAQKRTDAFVGAVDDAKAEYDAIQNVEDATRAKGEAIAAESEARRAAAGDSEEYRAALGRIADAEEAIGDAREGVTDAIASRTDAENELSEAIAGHAERVRDLMRAEQDAERSRRDSLEAQRDALAAQRKVNADLTSSDEDKRDAAYAVEVANENVANATSDHKDALDDLTDAQRRGVNGDKEVVEARKKVADANDAVRDAENKVAEAVKARGEAETAASQVISAAKAKVAEAARATKDAVNEEALANAALVTQQQGATAGAYALLAALEKLGGDPVLIALLKGALSEQQNTGVTSLGPTAPPGATNAERRDRSAQGMTVNNVVNLVVPTRQAGKAAAAHLEGKFNKMARDAG